MLGSLFGKKKDVFASPFTGRLCSITETPDEAFAEKMNGDGFMVEPSDGDVFAPADGTVSFVFETRHAMGLTTKDGLEYLLHIGIDTVKLQGKGFTVFHFHSIKFPNYYIFERGFSYALCKHQNYKRR